MSSSKRNTPSSSSRSKLSSHKKTPDDYEDEDDGHRADIYDTPYKQPTPRQPMSSTTKVPKTGVGSLNFTPSKPKPSSSSTPTTKSPTPKKQISIKDYYTDDNNNHHNNNPNINHNNNNNQNYNNQNYNNFKDNDDNNNYLPTIEDESKMSLDDILSSILIFSCLSCQVILFDSTMIINSSFERDLYMKLVKCYILKSSLKVSALSQDKELIESSLSGENNCFYHNLNCKVCHSPIGRYYTSTNPLFTFLQDHIVIKTDSISFYHIGSKSTELPPLPVSNDIITNIFETMSEMNKRIKILEERLKYTTPITTKNTTSTKNNTRQDEPYHHDDDDNDEQEDEFEQEEEEGVVKQKQKGGRR
ncbi:hypothetical protein CYY_001313 [Polysphondylium violaceum]|uniref:Mis18 domain-containing protein n=1 Tax=Polysphondylium violaceum TaxID=133409 RepID=A0A8J4V1R2_9MYCE|nr:hypothetical protein CYY_001313 [Polysphondylium violaceum]